ncbi:hypothetical protein AMAG_01440 [Allomyces macrogynus ATCC 38327]|uniref:Actin interacting protein 3 C-terminal domain-containing protein n=1 Tax=Allomyces macrogynus (strain ATCC 38327) TaxID=578462 RepID=A0A0L0RZH6_ALLM3|nr:hypothetical protein AMAG_01440 [Allomyces macrogynus ATCC 38327]|eukprot:KNE55550.1 hypothetical protein AMAG_01440 [Allomyces macrogynus ATCC 38327]
MAAPTAPLLAPSPGSPDAPHKAVRDLAAAARLLLTALVDDVDDNDTDDALNRQYADVLRSFHAAIAALYTAKVDVSAWCTFPDNFRAALEAVVGGHDEEDEDAEAVSGAHLHGLLTTTVRAMHDALQAAVDDNDGASAATGPVTQPGSGSGSGSVSGAASGTGSAATRTVQEPASPRQPKPAAATAPALPARRPMSPTVTATVTRAPAPLASPTRDRPLPTVPAPATPVSMPTAPPPTAAPVPRPTSPRSPIPATSGTAAASRSPVRSAPVTAASCSRATSPRAAAPPPLAPSTPDPTSPDTTATAAAAQALQQLRLDLVTILATLPSTTGAPLPSTVASQLASIRMHIDSVLPPSTNTTTTLLPTEPASPTTAARDHVTLAHRRVSADLASLADRVDDMAAVVDALRHDMVTRGAVPAHAVLAYAKAEHAGVAAAVEATRAAVARERPTWKAVWEAELHRVVEEQEFLDAVVEQVNAVADRATQAEAVVAQLARVAELADRHPRAVLPRRSSSASASLGFPEDDEDAGLATVLHELATVLDADTAAAASPRRVRAVLRTERVRAWARQFHRPMSAFGGELRAFLGLPADDEAAAGEGAMSPGGTRLRATGGVEAVERARAERDRAVLAALAKGGAT